MRGGAHTGVEGIARVIRDSSGRSVAALAIALPVVRIDEAKRQKLVALVKRGAALISYQLAFSDAANPVRDIQEIYRWWK